jgi:hypothetical protein
MYMEMLGQNGTCGREYPLLDYLVNGVWFPDGREGKGIVHPRNLLRDFFVLSPALRDLYGEYVCDRLFPKLVEFLITVCGWVETLQFFGKVSSMTDFCDEIFHFSREFPITEVVHAIEQTSSIQKKYLALSFLLSNFSEPRVIASLLDYCQNTISGLNSAIESAECGRSALALIRTLLTFSSAQEFVLPPKSDSSVDVLSLIPPQWLVHGEGKYALDSYIADASARIDVFGGDRPNGRNSELWLHLLHFLKDFRQLPIKNCMALTGLITLALSIAPDLINADLADSIRCIVESFNEKESVSVPAVGDIDTVAVRTGLFVEFAKEIHATFIASEQSAMKTSVHGE